MPKRGLNLPKARTFKTPAPIWKRAAAFILDILILNLVVLFPFQKIFNKIIPTDNYQDAYTLLTNNPGLASTLTTITIIITILFILYFSILEFKFKQTLGKMFMNIYIVSDLKKLNFWQCLVRNLFLLPFIPFILLWIIDPLYILFSKEQRRFSDIIAKTKVIEERIMG